MSAANGFAEPAEPGRWARLRAWRPSIGVVMAVGFGGLVAIAVGSVLAIALGAAQRNTFELLRASAETEISALVEGLRAQLDAPRDAVEYVAQAIETGLVAPDDDRRIGDLLIGALAATPQVRGITFVRPDLHAVAAGRRPGAGPSESTSGNWMDRPEIRLAVRLGETEKGLAWDDPFYLTTLEGTHVTLRRPVDRGDSYLGVVAAAVSISGLSNLLDKLPVAMAARPFVLLGKDHVLAHPALAGGARDGSPDKPLPTLAEVGDPVLAAMWSKSGRELDRILAGSTVKGRQIRASGEDYLFLYREVGDYGPTPWLVGVYFPMAVTEAPIERLVLAGAVGVGILLAAVALALLLGRGVGRPVRRLAEAAQAIRQFDLASLPPLERSVLRELDAAAGAYNAMVAALRWFETYVPRALVLMLLRRPPGVPLRPEEREVTVMFTDIVGFTPISRRLRPLQLARFLTRHFTLVGGCIEREGGTLDKYMGDSVMAFWNAPESQDDHAVRAARAALAIACALRDDNARRRRKGINPVRLRIALHSGTALVGNTGAPGRINYTLVGETVNICQRLEELGRSLDSEDDDVLMLVSGATAGRLSAEFTLDPLGRHPLRGTGAVFEVFRLLDQQQRPALAAALPAAG
ncbi:MAG: adenylate/guanylate cyclase domain-containing protein [Rhodospirillaceae bacterium]|nr:adenylate/guanylate cyclase domain-containing protein [Rhodospirillaceae bacterium]